MIVNARRFDAPALDAFHETVEIRRHDFGVELRRGRHVATDFTLLERAAPFMHQFTQRCTLTIVFAGACRIDERGRSDWLRPGDLLVSDASRGGTEAYAGEATSGL